MVFVVLALVVAWLLVREFRHLMVSALVAGQSA